MLKSDKRCLLFILFNLFQKLDVGIFCPRILIQRSLLRNSARVRCIIQWIIIFLILFFIEAQCITVNLSRIENMRESSLLFDLRQFHRKICLKNFQNVDYKLFDGDVQHNEKLIAAIR